MFSSPITKKLGSGLILILKDKRVFSQTIGEFLMFSTRTKISCPLSSFSKMFSSRAVSKSPISASSGVA